LAQAKQADGLAGLGAVVDEAAARQLGLAKKAQQFPDDEATSLALGAAETGIHQVSEALVLLAGAAGVSMRETGAIKDLAKSAQARESYNRVFAEALPLAREAQASGDDMPLDMFFSAVKSQFEKAETEYNWALAEKKPNVLALAAIFDEALVDYSASLDVAYDVVEAVQQENLLPEIVLTEDEEDEIKVPVDAARAETGGQATIEKLFMSLFDVIIKNEENLSKDKESVAFQNALARSKAEYSFTESYEKSTAAKQEGLTPEEKLAAE
jgi:hypothetical protein